LREKRSTLRIHSRPAQLALNMWNGWTRNLETRGLANHTMVCLVPHPFAAFAKRWERSPLLSTKSHNVGRKSLAQRFIAG